MATQAVKNSITLPTDTIRRQGGMVILPLREYKKLCERAVPTYYLHGKEAEELDRLVEEGLKEHEEGKTIEASSLEEALKIYERKQNKKN